MVLWLPLRRFCRSNSSSQIEEASFSKWPVVIPAFFFFDVPSQPRLALIRLDAAKTSVSLLNREPVVALSCRADSFCSRLLISSSGNPPPTPPTPSPSRLLNTASSSSCPDHLLDFFTPRVHSNGVSFFFFCSFPDIEVSCPSALLTLFVSPPRNPDFLTLTDAEEHPQLSKDSFPSVTKRCLPFCHLKPPPSAVSK